MDLGRSQMDQVPKMKHLVFGSRARRINNPNFAIHPQRLSAAGLSGESGQTHMVLVTQSQRSAFRIHYLNWPPPRLAPAVPLIDSIRQL